MTTNLTGCLNQALHGHINFEEKPRKTVFQPIHWIELATQASDTAMNFFSFIFCYSFRRFSQQYLPVCVGKKPILFCVVQSVRVFEWITLIFGCFQFVSWVFSHANTRSAVIGETADFPLKSKLFVSSESEKEKLERQRVAFYRDQKHCSSINAAPLLTRQWQLDNLKISRDEYMKVLTKQLHQQNIQAQKKDEKILQQTRDIEALTKENAAKVNASYSQQQHLKQITSLLKESEDKSNKQFEEMNQLNQKIGRLEEELKRKNEKILQQTQGIEALTKENAAKVNASYSQQQHLKQVTSVLKESEDRSNKQLEEMNQLNQKIGQLEEELKSKALQLEVVNIMNQSNMTVRPRKQSLSTQQIDEEEIYADIQLSSDKSNASLSGKAVELMERSLNSLTESSESVS
ncbi:MAG: hypothetical protein AAF443_02615 [Chlamydiota bacterium]